MNTRPGSPRAATQPHGPLNLGDYLRVLYRRRWTAGLALLVVFVYGAFNSLKKTAIYEATTQVLIEKEARRATSLNSVLEQGGSYYDDDFYQTQYRVLQSRALAWRAAQALGLKPDTPMPPTGDAQPGLFGQAKQWVLDTVGAPKQIQPPPPDETTAQAALIGGFLGGLYVSPVRNTHLVELRYRSPDPEFAAKAANAIAEQYIEQTVQSRFDATKETTDYLGVELEKQRRKVQESEQKLQDYQMQNNAVGVDDRQNVIVQGQADLNTNLIRAKTDRIDKQELYKTLMSLQGNRAALESHSAIISSDLVQGVKKTADDLRRRKVELSNRYQPAAPQMQDLDRQIQQAESKLQIEIDKVIESVKNDYQTAQNREDQFQQLLTAQNAEAVRLNRKGVAYGALKQEADSNKALYESLLQRAKETGISGEFKGTNIRVMDRAEIPRAPVLPNTRRDLMTSFLLGCALAVGLAFGFEYLDSRIRTPDEIKTHLGIPFLGLVPVVSDKDSGGRSPLLSEGAPATFGEAIRAIRTAVVFSSAEEGARTIVVTSTAPGEGKTMVSSNLAVALAQADQRTIIVDGDMRRPRVHEVFDRLQEPGLSNVLVGTSELHSSICRTSVPNLFVLSAGHIPPNPAELLGSSKYRELLRDLRRQFDWIIVDAPPVMAVTDAAVVATDATGVVFVVGAEMTSRRHASFAVEQLTSVKAHFIGAVLNRADVQRHGYYYSTYYRKDYTQAYTRTS